MQRTLVLLKPDAVQRGLTGEIISRLEARGLKIIAMRLTHVTQELAHRHYHGHVGKPFFQGLTDFITSGPLVAMVLEGRNAIEAVRLTMGVTDPAKASPGTIRGDLAMDIGRNLVHGSDSAAAAQEEIALFFQQDDQLDYQRNIDHWITES